MDEYKRGWSVIISVGSKKVGCRSGTMVSIKTLHCNDLGRLINGDRWLLNVIRYDQPQYRSNGSWGCHRVGIPVGCTLACRTRGRCPYDRWGWGWGRNSPLPSNIPPPAIRRIMRNVRKRMWTWGGNWWAYLYWTPNLMFPPLKFPRSLRKPSASR